MLFRKVTLEVTARAVDSDLVMQALNYALERIEERVTVIWSDIDAQPSPKSGGAEQYADPEN